MESSSIAAVNDFLKNLSVVDMFAGACTLVAVSISGYQITRHLLHFNEQKIQLQIIRILAIIPVSHYNSFAKAFRCIQSQRTFL